MYAGAVAVPLIIGRALKLPPEDVAFLISADLFACGLATLVQCLGFPGVGIRLPVMMGVTLRLGRADASRWPPRPDIGLLGIYGSVIAAGVFGIVAAPFVSRLLPLFPPVVTGSIILVIGISLMRVGINWAGGGLPTLTRWSTASPAAFPIRPSGQLQGLGISLFVLLFILGLIKWGTGFLANVSVLLGIVAGAVLATILGVMHFDKVAAASWGALVIPFRFGMPQFHLVPVVTMCVVMIVVMIESLGMFLALGDITGKTDRPRSPEPGLARRRRRHAARRHLQHLSLHLVLAECRPRSRCTGVRSRWVTVTRRLHHARARAAAEARRAWSRRCRWWCSVARAS